MTKQMMVLLALFIYMFVCSVFIEPNSLTVNSYEIEDQQLQGVRIVFASDFHLKPKDHNKLDRIVKTINRQEADLVLLGGDFLDGHSADKTMRPNDIAQKIALIKAPVYSVLGESDYTAGANDLISAFNYNRLRILKNTAARVVIKRRYVDVIGLDDITTQNVDLPRAFYGTMMPKIVLSHNPDIYYDITENVSLILAGHTHGGQFLFPFSPPLFVSSKYGTEFASGLIKLTVNKMIITKGIGTSFLPVRFNCKPEIVVIDFIEPKAIIQQ